MLGDFSVNYSGSGNNYKMAKIIYKVTKNNKVAMVSPDGYNIKKGYKYQVYTDILTSGTYMSVELHDFKNKKDAIKYANKFVNGI